MKDLTPIRTPDYIEAFKGYRAWLPSNGRLVSTRYGRREEWPTDGPLVASCRPDGTREPCRQVLVPNPRCRCGIYARASLAEVIRYFNKSLYYVGVNALLVYGEVELWGKVIPGSTGWRSQYCRVTRLFSLSSFYSLLSYARVWRIAERYDVPVERVRDVNLVA